MSVLLPIIPIDRLPDHILWSGLELMEALFTNFFGTVFMAAYLETPPSLQSVPLGGLLAPQGVSGDRSVAPRGVPAGSVLSPTGGIGVNVGASLFTMGALGVPEGMPVLNMGGLGHRPDPDKGVSNIQTLTTYSNLEYVDSPPPPSTAPCSRRQIRRTSPPTTLLLRVQVVVWGYLLHWWHLAASRVPPFLCCIPLSQSANQIPMRRGRLPLASVAAPCSHPWFLGPVIWMNTLGHSLPLTDIRGALLVLFL
jgi:hypothetical protein